MKKSVKSIISIAAASLLFACNGNSGWSVSGKVDGAEKGTKMALEAYNAGAWYVMDSVEINAKGEFKYAAADTLPATDILRLTLPGKGSVCFPVAAHDHITVDATVDNFGTKHRIGGSELAARVNAIDSLVAAGGDIDALQRSLVGFITSDTTGLVAYYALGKAINDKPVFNPNENFGNRVYGAVAQVYAHYLPNDPRGKAVARAYIQGRQNMGKFVPAPAEQVVEVPETGVIDIVRYDDKGKRHSLAEMAKTGKVIVLSFTNYSTEWSPAYNTILNDMYKLYHDRGLEIYQIAFDGDEVQWKGTARNLPWVTVWNSPTDGAQVLASYNVGGLPTAYIINRAGELSARVSDPAKLSQSVAKYF